MKLRSLALVTLLFATNLCAAKTKRTPPRLTQDDKIWEATAVVIANTALYSGAFLVLGYLAYSQFEAADRLKWGAICGLLVGIYQAAAKYRETTDSGANLASGQKPQPQQTEPTSAGN